MVWVHLPTYSQSLLASKWQFSPSFFSGVHFFLCVSKLEESGQEEDLHLLGASHIFDNGNFKENATSDGGGSWEGSSGKRVIQILGSTK